MREFFCVLLQIKRDFPKEVSQGCLVYHPFKTIMKKITFFFICIGVLLSQCFAQKPQRVCQASAECGSLHADASIPAVIVDTDLGSSTDDLIALALLYRYHRAGLCDLRGVIVDRMGDSCAVLADIMNTYYGFGHLPIGLERGGVPNPKVYIDYCDIARYKDAKGKPLLPRMVSDITALPDGWRLYRRLLAEADDGSVAVIALGFFSTLVQLLESPADDISPLTGLELVRRKVRGLYLMGAKFDEGDGTRMGYNIGKGPDFARRCFDLWPSQVPVWFSVGSVGDTIDYDPDLVIADIGWTDRNPIKQVYMNHNCRTGQRMWDALPVIQAIEGDNQFHLSQPGTVKVLSDTEIIFIPTPTGNCRYQNQGNADWNSLMLDKIRAAARWQP